MLGYGESIGNILFLSRQQSVDDLALGPTVLSLGNWHMCNLGVDLLDLGLLHQVHLLGSQGLRLTDGCHGVLH